MDENHQLTRLQVPENKYDGIHIPLWIVLGFLGGLGVQVRTKK